MAARRTKDHGDAEEQGLEALPLSEVAPQRTRFVVEPYLPLGSITLLEGDPSAGKSYVAADLGAAVTRGRTPDLGLGHEIAKTAPRAVLYLTREDSPNTLRDRFAAQGADLQRVFVVSQHVSACDFAPLDRLVQARRPGLLVIDPIHALLDRTNMSAANSVRIALAPLADLALRHGLAVVAVRHLSKSGSGRAMYRGLGSVDFAAAARSIVRIAEDPQRPGSRVMVHVKNSLGAPGCAVEFEVGERLTWLGRSELAPQDLDAKPSRERGRSAVEIAEAFLDDLLRSGTKPAAEVAKAAREAGIAERTLERAEKSLGIRHLRVNEGGSGRGRGHWVWSLPSGSGHGAVGGLEPSS